MSPIMQMLHDYALHAIREEYDIQVKSIQCSKIYLNHRLWSNKCFNLLPITVKSTYQVKQANRQWNKASDIDNYLGNYLVKKLQRLPKFWWSTQEQGNQPLYIHPSKHNWENSLQVTKKLNFTSQNLFFSFFLKLINWCFS